MEKRNVRIGFMIQSDEIFADWLKEKILLKSREEYIHGELVNCSTIEDHKVLIEICMREAYRFGAMNCSENIDEFLRKHYGIGLVAEEL